MKKTNLFCLVLLVVANSLLAQVEFAASTKISSQYIMITGGISHNKPVVQSDFGVHYRGFYGIVWNSSGLDDANLNSNFGDEINYIVGCSRRFGKLVADVGFIGFDAYPLLDTPIDFAYYYVGGVFQTNLVNITAKQAYVKPVYGCQVSGGLITWLGLEKSHDWHWFISDFNANLVFDHGTLDMQQCSLVEIKSRFSRQVGRLNFGVEWWRIKPLTPTTDGREHQSTWSVFCGVNL